MIGMPLPTLLTVHTVMMYKVLLVNPVNVSRHTVVCRAAQEAGAPHREYIYRKKVNAIFTPLYLRDSLSD